MSFDVHQIIRDELDPREKLIWTGVPKQGMILRVSDIFMIPFSLVWGCGAIIWEISSIFFLLVKLNSGTTLSDDTGIFFYAFPLLGLPFVILGLYMMFGRFIYDVKIRAKTFYGLTSQRAIIISGLFNKEVKSIDLSSLTDVSLCEKQDKTGTIRFNKEDKIANFFESMNMGGSSQPCFEFIENAKEVYNKLRTQKRA